MKSILATLALVFVCVGAHASEIQSRIELMKYTIQLEQSLPLNLEEKSASFKFSLIEEAHAYKEGETCLILGFKSKFKKGMCRLSEAEGIADLKKQCSPTQYPCNPQVFGTNTSKPFCVSRSIKRDLSKACAHENIKAVQAKHPSEHLKEVLGKGLSDFNLDKLDVTKLEEESLKQLQSQFTSKNSDIKTAIQFTQSLCEDLKQSTKRGHQPFDVKICDSQLKTLVASEGNVTPTKKEVIQSTEVTPSVEPKIEIKSIEDCVDCKKAQQEIIDDKIEEKVNDLKIVTDKTDAQAYFACINEFEKHPEIKKQIDNINDWKKEYSRATGYWHELDGKRNFGLLCDPFHETKEEFVFVSEDGFKVVSNIKDEIRGAETVSQFKSGETDYYIVQDILGNYFELFPKKQLSSASEDAREDVAKYHKRGGKASGKLEPVSSDRTDFAKSCIKQRMTDYLDWMTYKETPMPSTSQFNADIAVYNNGEREKLKEKYKTPADQIITSRYTEIMEHIPSCKGIIEEKDWIASFKSNQSSKIELYNKMRGYLDLKD